MASGRNGTLYTGVTNDLIRRVEEHKRKIISGFTSEHDVNELVYYETHEDINSAIAREKRLKKWNRIWKLRLIEEMNPAWCDLYEELVEAVEKGID